MSHPARPIPHDPQDLVKIADGAMSGPVAGPDNPLGAGRKTLFQKLPKEVRKALCSSILGGMGPTEAKQVYGVDPKTYYRYKNELKDYVDEIATAKTAARKKKVEEEMEWALGMAKTGAEMARDKKVPLREKGAVVKLLDPITGQDQVVMVDKPDMAAMSMFLKDAREAVAQIGELHELTGKGADRKNSRRMLREEIAAKQDIAAKMLQGQGGVGGQLNVFLVPKLPGVQQYPGLPPATQIIEVPTDGDDGEDIPQDKMVLAISPSQEK